MKIHHNSLRVLKEAIKQKRQLTLAERMQANEVFAALRANIGVREPDRRPKLAPFKDEHGNEQPADSAAVARLKLRGLYEIAKHARDNPDDESDFLVALFNEAANDFNHDPDGRHARGVPPQVAAARATRAALAGEALVQARLAEVEEYAQGLEERIATLEQGAAFMAERFDALDSALKALENARMTDNNTKGSDA